MEVNVNVKSQVTTIDFEEELECFTLRTVKADNKIEAICENTLSRNYKIETDILPLLVKDIHLLTLPDRSFSETITAYGFPFASALIYGRICSTGASANGKHRYCLDDGTGVIQVRLVRREDPKDITKLDNECYRVFGNNEELYKCVQSILNKTRKQLLEVGYLTYGTNALLIGRPHRSFGEVVFSVFELIMDTNLDNNLEISVKNFIVDWYIKHYKGRQLKDLPLRT